MDIFKVREKNQKRQEGGGMHYNTLKTKTQTSLKKYKGDFVRTQT